MDEKLTDLENVMKQAMETVEFNVDGPVLVIAFEAQKRHIVTNLNAEHVVLVLQDAIDSIPASTVLTRERGVH